MPIECPRSAHGLSYELCPGALAGPVGIWRVDLGFFDAQASFDALICGSWAADEELSVYAGSSATSPVPAPGRAATCQTVSGHTSNRRATTITDDHGSREDPSCVTPIVEANAHGAYVRRSGRRSAGLLMVCDLLTEDEWWPRF